MVHSEYFHPEKTIPDFDSWRTVCRVLTNSEEQEKRENIIVLKTGHVNQSDAVILDPEVVNKNYCKG